MRRKYGIPLPILDREEWKEDYARELYLILSKHKPQRVKRIKSLLLKHKGRQQKLLADVRRKYGIPDPFFKRVSVAVRVRPGVKDGCLEVLGGRDLQRT